MNLISQYIKVIWDKDYRGGKGAIKRNKINNQFQLPANLTAFKSSSHQAIIHKIVYSATNDFEKPIVDELLVMAIEELKNIGCFHFKFLNKQMQVIYRWYPELGGAPARIQYDKAGNKINLKQKSFCLKMNEMGRGEYNGRYADEDTGEWRYEKLTLNTCLTVTLDRDIFMHGPYLFHYRQLAKLW